MLVLVAASCGAASSVPASPADVRETPSVVPQTADATPKGSVGMETETTGGTAVAAQTATAAETATAEQTAAASRRFETPTPRPLATRTPGRAATPGPTATLEPTTEVSTVTLTIVYDNNAYGSAVSKGLRTSWGFACWVETGEATVLFDTGGDGPTLLNNLERLGLDPRTIDVVVLSHAHGDHTGGLDAVLAAGGAPTVYVPASFPESFKQGLRGRTKLVDVTDGATVAPGIRSTGEVGTSIVEQALVVDTADGPVVVTGCAHPCVVEMVRRAEVEHDEGIALVLGGFHLGGAGRGRIEGIVGDLQSLGVKRVAPCHCTGDQARRMFSKAFDDDCIMAGVGWSSEYVLESE